MLPPFFACVCIWHMVHKRRVKTCLLRWMEPHISSAYVWSLSFMIRFVIALATIVRRKHVLNEGLGVNMVQEHGLSMHANRVKIIKMPDADGRGGHITCTCCVPSRWRLLCCDALAVLKRELSSGYQHGF